MSSRAPFLPASAASILPSCLLGSSRLTHSSRAALPSPRSAPLRRCVWNWYSLVLLSNTCSPPRVHSNSPGTCIARHSLHPWLCWHIQVIRWREAANLCHSFGVIMDLGAFVRIRTGSGTAAHRCRRALRNPTVRKLICLYHVCLI